MKMIKNIIIMLLICTTVLISCSNEKEYKEIGTSQSIKPLEQIRVRFDFTAATSLKITVDGKEQQEKTYKKGDKLFFTGNTNVILQISQARAVKARINGLPYDFGNRNNSVYTVIRRAKDKNNNSEIQIDNKYGQAQPEEQKSEEADDEKKILEIN